MNSNIESRKAILDRQYLLLLEEEARLENLPKEPSTTEDGDNTILFKIRFKPSGISYTYVATRIFDGLWFVSGPTQRNNGGYTWERLVEWITSSSEWEIWHVTGYELLGNG